MNEPTEYILRLISTDTGAKVLLSKAGSSPGSIISEIVDASDNPAGFKIFNSELGVEILITVHFREVKK